MEHILFGFDHLLFVLALMLIVRSTRVLVWTITAFTVAHSITLALATLGVVDAPGPPVEATIALSILLLAAEILNVRRGQPGLTARWPWAVAFSFGLLHGFGFAGALTAIGLPKKDMPLALFAFNVGVEVGQLPFIAAVLGLLALRGSCRSPVLSRGTRCPPRATSSARSRRSGSWSASPRLPLRAGEATRTVAARRARALPEPGSDRSCGAATSPPRRRCFLPGSRICAISIYVRKIEMERRFP